MARAHPFVLLSVALAALLAVGRAQTLVKSDSGVNIYYRTGWTTPYIHYSTGSGWTTVPGKAMIASTNSDFPSSLGWFHYAFADSVTSLEFVFNNGNGVWDNNDEDNYKVTAGTWQLTSLVSTPSSTGAIQGVFAHYMPGGMTEEQAAQDVTDAIAMGLDAFIINVSDLVSSWSLNCVKYLFTAAEAQSFKLFFSWDMSVISSPDAVLSLMEQYASSSAYYTFNGRPVTTTFIGGSFSSSTWQSSYKDALADKDIDTYFIPDFDDVNPGDNFFDKFPVADGTLCWGCSWADPSTAVGVAVNVSTSLDQVYIDACEASDKTYMMGLSTHQYKHMDTTNNWYRSGGANVGRRIEQILKTQPDFVEIITWNDAGEGHYIGNLWLWSLDSSPAIQAYVYGYPHQGFQEVYIPFIAGAKAGATSLSDLAPQNDRQVQGAMWYHPLLNGGDCSADTLGKPGGYQAALDEVNVVATFATSGAKVTVSSAGSQIASFTATKGLNYWSATGVKAGEVQVDITGSDGASLSSTVGNVTVASSMALCNYNYAVFSL